MKKLIYAVDFDGTLVEHKFPEIGEQKDLHKIIGEFIKKQHEKGNVIILWTCRTGKHLDEAVKWCKDNNIPIDYINENHPKLIELMGDDSRKIFADYYIDDRAVNCNKFVLPNEEDI